MTYVRASLITLSPARRLALIALAAIAAIAVLVVACAVVLRSSGSNARAKSVTGNVSAARTSAPVIPQGPQPTLAPSDSAALTDALGRIAAMSAVQPRTSKAYPAIPASLRGQADLYARAFATELLTVDYARPREELLSWVQSETATTDEPRVIGLVPVDQRLKYGVWSLTDPVSFATPPIDSAADWQAWASKHGRSSVEVVRVTEPMKWSNAVSDGQISDPGVTARDVDAVVTTTWIEQGKTRSAKYSVSLSLTLEGPPTRADYRFVNTVAFNTVTIGG